MTLSPREKWMFVLTVFKISQTGKAMPLEMQQAVTEFLRKKVCPELSYDEWRDMEIDIRKIKSEVIDLMYEGMQAATSDTKLPPEAQKMFSEIDLSELDNKTRGAIKQIDFDKLKKALDSLPKDKKKELEPMFANIENLAGEYKEEGTDENKES